MPNTPSGTRNTGSAEPAWMRPKMTPVAIAPPATPIQRRSAVKQKPRKNSSSAIGAATQTRTATKNRAVEESSAPSSCGRSSFSSIPSAAAQIPENAMNATQAASIQPTPRSAATERSPNCAGVGLPAVSLASSQADTISAPSWKNVPVIVTPGGGSPASTWYPASCAMTVAIVAPRTAIPSVTSIAANGAHGGQAGRSSRGERGAGSGGTRSGGSPSGSSGRRSGSEPEGGGTLVTRPRRVG